MYDVRRSAVAAKGERFLDIHSLVKVSNIIDGKPRDDEDCFEVSVLLWQMCAVDLAEVYSPARFHNRACRLGLSPGLAVDLETGWDLSIPAQRRECENVLKDQNPVLRMRTSGETPPQLHLRDP